MIEHQHGIKPPQCLHSVPAACSNISVQSFSGTGYGPMGNLRTTDQDGPYSLRYVPVQVAEVKGEPATLQLPLLLSQVRLLGCGLSMYAPLSLLAAASAVALLHHPLCTAGTAPHRTTRTAPWERLRTHVVSPTFWPTVVLHALLMLCDASSTAAGLLARDGFTALDIIHFL
jgi:hypothetical protein